ncbi:hypothetical protein TWF281_004084 [Arthrobotrys megalospora]
MKITPNLLTIPFILATTSLAAPLNLQHGNPTSQLSTRSLLPRQNYNKVDFIMGKISDVVQTLAGGPDAANSQGLQAFNGILNTIGSAISSFIPNRDPNGPNGPVGNVPNGPVGNLPNGPVGNLPNGPVGNIPGNIPGAPIGGIPGSPIGNIPGAPNGIPGAPIGNIPGAPVGNIPGAPNGGVPGGPGGLGSLTPEQLGARPGTVI